MADAAVTAGTVIEDLTDAEREQMEQVAAERQARLDAFAGALSKKRKEAVDGRMATGIEQEWLEDEEFYEGIDDANRGEVGAGIMKPVSQTGSASAKLATKSTRSNVFLNITRPYVDFSAGRAADMLLPTDDRAWSIGPTPMPEIMEARSSNQVFTVAGRQATYGQVAQMMLDEAKAGAEAAQRRIEDWQIESQFHAEVRKVIKDASKVGTGILKGPFPVKRKARSITRGDDGSVAIKITQETKPASKRIDYWNFFPDPACGENIHNGSFTWERDYITARQLRDLKGTKDSDGNPFYIENSIDTCLAEGPQKKYENMRDAYVGDSEQFEIWYYYGIADAEDLTAAGCSCEASKVLNVLVTMVNDRVIKAALSPLDSGEFPYDVMVWQARSGHWAGIGVARQVRTPQRMINAGSRNMMDNAGLAAGPQIIMRRKAVTPSDGVYELKPRKIWFVDENSDIAEVAHAFTAVAIPMMQQELLAIIEFAMKMAEDVTGLPLLMQGQAGSAPETVGGMTMLQNNASTVLRSIAKSFDDLITSPHIRRYYEWLLLYGPDEKEKQDFAIDARGSSALFERDAQNQAILQMGAIVKDPAFGIDPKKWIKEALLAQRLDPKRFQYSEEEMQQVEENMQHQPPDPRIAAAQINAEAGIKKAQISASATVQKSKLDTDRDTVYVEAEGKRAQVAADAAERKLQIEYQLAQLKYANDRQISLDDVRAMLTSEAAKINLQRELAHLDAHTKQVLAPPAEPPGRAPAGHAYEK